jgi:hypothetical protein
MRKKREMRARRRAISLRGVASVKYAKAYIFLYKVTG